MDKICPIIQFQISRLGSNISLPNKERNYTIFNKRRDDEIMAQANHAVNPLKDFLNYHAKSEEQIVDGLHILDKMIDNKIEGADKFYPVISKFNNTKSPNIQVMLSGIYRKTLVPDAFGPLNRMLYTQITNPNSPYFDPTEETGGAILEYIRSYGAQNAYLAQNMPKSGAYFNVSK